MFKPTKKMLIFGLFIIVLLVSRFSFLDLRPVHFDEGVNAWFVNQMFSTGYYKYDPQNYHGPLYFNVLWVAESVFGSSISVHRAATAVFGCLLALLLFQFNKIFRGAGILSAIGVVLSAGYLFYSRYSIHEIPYAFFTALSLWGVLLWQNKDYKYAVWYFVFGIIACFCLKETAVLHLAALGFSLLYVELWMQKKSNSSLLIPNFKYWVKPLALSLCVWLLLYTGFFQNSSGINDFFKAFLFWQKTGLQEHGGHIKPFWYWVDLMRLYEPIFLLGFFYSLVKIVNIKKRTDVVYVYGISIFLLFSMIPYKTPWNAYSFFWVFAISSGVAFRHLFSYDKKIQKILIAGISVLVFMQIYQSIWVNYIKYEDPVNKLAYVHTRNDLKEALSPLFLEAKKNPEVYYLSVAICTESYWPLPFVLEDFQKVIYSSGKISENTFDADVILIDKEDSKELESKLRYLYFSRDVRFRDSQKMARIYYKREFFDLAHLKEFKLTE